MHFQQTIITARKRSLGQGNIFSSVCQKFCSRGGGVPGQVHPRAGTPPGQVHPPGRYASWAGTPPGQVHSPPGCTPPRQVHPLGRWAGTPPGQVHLPGQVHTPRKVHPPGQVHAPGQVHPPGRYIPPRSSTCWEIRAKSGRYASYLNAFLSGYASKWIHHWRIWRCGCITVPSVNPNSKIFMDFFRKYRQKVAPFAFQEIHSCSPFKFMPCLLYHQTSFWWMSKLHIIYVTGANNEA